MSREETKKIVRIMVASYTSFRPTTEELKDMTDAWNLMLSDYSYNDVVMALKSYIVADTSQFPPSVGQIVDRIHTIRSPDVMSGADAWKILYDAMGKSSVFEDALESYNSLPETIKRCVGSANVLHEWGTDANFNESVTRSNFLKLYDLQLRRDAEMVKIPSDVKKFIESEKIGIEEK